MIMQHCGHPLSDFFKIYRSGISEMSIANLAIALIDLIRIVHEKHFVHRDIKPSNICYKASKENGREQRLQVCLIDFGNAKRYRNEYQYLIKEGERDMYVGTRTFSSPSFHRGVVHSCKDDLLSMIFVLAYMYTGRLPWSGMTVNDKAAHERLIIMKERVSWKLLFPNFSQYFQFIVNYVRKLKVQHEIDYDMLIRYMKKALWSKGPFSEN